MTVRLRNVNADLQGPVGDWPFEAVLTVLERAGLQYWGRLANEIEQHPWGLVARKVEQAIAVTDCYAAGELFSEFIAQSRESRDQQYRSEVAAELRSWVGASGLTAAEFASRVGTSGSRLSTYLSGGSVPSAALLLRMRHEVDSSDH